MIDSFLPTQTLVGRETDVEQIAARALETRALVVLGEPGCGTSEVLRHVCGRLSSSGARTPFYIELGKDGVDRDVLSSRLVEDSFVVIDSAHYADAATMRSIAAGFERTRTPCIIAGWRRALYPVLSYPSVRLERLPFEDTSKLVGQTAPQFGLELTDACRDLIALLIGGRPRMISLFLVAAADRTRRLDSFVAVQQIFTDEIMGGRIGREIDALLKFFIPERPRLTKVLSLLAENAGEINRAELNLGQRPFEYLNALELIDVDRGAVKTNLSDHVWSGYLRSRAAGPRALVVGKAMAVNVTSSTDIMKRHYRAGASLGLLAVLSRLDGEKVSRRAIDYGVFRESVKGLDEDAALKLLATDVETVELPRVFYTIETHHAYPPVGELIDNDRSALAIGSDSDGNEIAVFAAEIDSKLEAPRETAEFWCDRLEMAAVSCGFANFRILLVAPEGFDDDALKLLSERNAYGSSFAQFRLLQKVLEAEVREEAEPHGNAHEFVVPMGEAGELLSAKVVDDLAARYRIPAKDAHQIKTALIEALINAAEHSLSPERTTRERFVVAEDSITITVANRGVRLTDKRDAADENTTRRGWGLQLIRKLMDDIRLDNTDDGTRLTMTKRFRRSPQGLG